MTGGVLAARACTIDNSQDFMHTSPDDRIWLLGLALDGLQALPMSKEEYVARTRGELEHLVRFFCNLDRSELKLNNRSMECIVINDDRIAMRNSKFLGELHSAFSVSVVVLRNSSTALKGRLVQKPLSIIEQKTNLLS